MRARLRRDAGLSLIELTAAFALLSLVLAFVLRFYAVGAARVDAAQSGERLLAEGRRALEQVITGGTLSGGLVVPGLVSAKAAVVETDALAFHAGDTVVTYYRADGTLYRHMRPFDGSLTVTRSGGTAVARNVSAFQATVEAGSPPAVTVSITLAQGDAGPVILRTKTRLRNG